MYVHVYNFPQVTQIVILIIFNLYFLLLAGIKSISMVYANLCF